MDGPIASAVVIPEPEPEPSPPRAASPLVSHKRRQSSVSSDSSKRPRLANLDAPTESTTSPKQAKAPVRRERGRERRLFGAVLGALSQNPSSAAQKRRSEIEKRQLAQRRLDEEENQQRKAERTAKRKAQRWREHGRFEREAMRARHANLIDIAHFLRTETEPQLYYKPWETTPEEEARIQDQVARAHETIAREVEEYKARQEEETRREGQTDDAKAFVTGRKDDENALQHTVTTNGATNNNGAPTGDQDMTDHHAFPPTNDTPMEDHAHEDAQAASTPSREAAADAMDEMGEEIVEATEDTVIY